jgi:hypothetical protein
MYGDPVFRFTVNTTTGANEDDGLFTVDRNGKLRGDHQYISALAFVRHRERAADFYNELAARDEHLSRDERLAAIHEAAGQWPCARRDLPVHGRVQDDEPNRRALARRVLRRATRSPL